MPTSPRFGVLLLPNAPWPTLVARVCRAEELSFDVLWLGDHFVNPYAPEQDWFDAWTLLGALAASTTRIRLGPLVSGLTLRNPALLARMAMTVDHRVRRSPGARDRRRGRPLDVTMTGAATWTPRERVDRLEEAVRIVTGLFAGGPVDADGAYRIAGAVLHPLPVQRPRPPLTVSANGPRAMAVAARHADAWDTYAVAGGRDVRGALHGVSALDLIRSRCALMDEICDREGRDPSTLRRSLVSFQGISEPLLAPRAFADYIDAVRAAGIDDVTIYWPQRPEEEPALEAIAAEALPFLRQ